MTEMQITRSVVGTALRAVRGERSEAAGAGSRSRTARSAIPTTALANT